MADIKEEMSKIESAYKGKEIKEAILSTLDKINSAEGTARFLDGHGDSEFLTQEEFNKFMPLDETPTQGSEKGISSGKIFTYLDKMGKAIDNVNGVESSSGSTEPLKDKLEYLNETKRAIRKELIDKGVPVDPDMDTFRSYAEKIGQIELEANLDVQPLEITSNGTYEADEGTAYNPVTANVTFDLAPKTITKNGTYKAESEGHDGYSEVDVTASSALTTKTVSGDDFPADMEPLEYKASDEGEDVIGYSEIIVDLTEKVMEKDPVVLDPESAGEEYVYDAKDDDVYGYSKFTIMINDTSQFFTVKFMSDGEVVYTEDHVEKGDSCSYKGPALEKEGYVFSGWNPQPINVERDLTCVAKWVEDEKAQKEAGGSSGGGQTIDKMNWADVKAHPERIKNGDTKRIYWTPFDFGKFNFMGGSTVAKCIAKGEKGTNTTWYIRINIGDYINNITKSIEEITCPTPQASGGKTPSLIYEGQHPLYTFCTELNGAIQSCKGEGYEGQSDLNFASVEKVTLSLDGGTLKNKTSTLSGLWLFSMYELMANGDAGPNVGEGPKNGTVEYGSFSQFDLRTCPTTRSVYPFEEVKATTEAMAQKAGVNLNDLLAQSASFFKVPNSGSSQGADNNGKGLSIGWLYQENEDFYNSNLSPALYRSIYDIKKSGNLGAGTTFDKYGSVYLGFCL